mmetsp:Transcript_29118/g.43882  ORF Transcript_29118/g.43882 Transcript_29118/m.43882 type:complete len:122 (-) Transcript_29118:222-587(-)
MDRLQQLRNHCLFRTIGIFFLFFLLLMIWKDRACEDPFPYFLQSILPSNYLPALDPLIKKSGDIPYVLNEVDYIEVAVDLFSASLQNLLAELGLHLLKLRLLRPAADRRGPGSQLKWFRLH